MTEDDIACIERSETKGPDFLAWLFMVVAGWFIRSAAKRKDRSEPRRPRQHYVPSWELGATIGGDR